MASREGGNSYSENVILHRSNVFSSLKSVLRLSHYHLSWSTCVPEQVAAQQLFSFRAERHTGPPTAMFISMYLDSGIVEKLSRRACHWRGGWAAATVGSAAAFNNNAVDALVDDGDERLHVEGRRTYVRTTQRRQQWPTSSYRECFDVGCCSDKGCGHDDLSSKRADAGA